MKNIFKTTVICLGAFVLTACNDWLDTKTDSQLPESVTFSNIVDVQSATIGLYADLCSDPYNQLQTIHQGTGTDCELIDGFATEAEGGENERAGMNYNAVPGWAKINTLWEKQYKTIEDCNRIIDGVNNSDLKDNDAVMIATAEARVIRAMVYLDLVRVFGDIPLRWDAANADNIKQGKTDRDIILDKLIEDLEGVIEENKLPWCDKVTSEHINMGYAKGLLANIYMTRAGYALRENERQEAVDGKYSSASKQAEGYVEACDETKDAKAKYPEESQSFKTLRPSDKDCKVLYWKAAKQLKSIIDNGSHDLDDTFAGFWDNINKLQLDPKHESMFEIPMGFGLTGELGYTVGVRLNDVTKDFGFTNSSGKIKTTAVQLYSYAPCDTRRDITCAAFTIRSIDRTYTTKSNMTVDRDGIPGDVPGDLEGTIDVKTETGNDVTAERLVGNSPFELYIGKWDVRKMSDRWKQQNLVSSLKFGYGINVVRMRYPQILLWYAECLSYLIENGKPDATEDFNPDEYMSDVNVDGDMNWSKAQEYVQTVHMRAYNDAVNSYTGRTPSTDKTEFNKELSSATNYESMLDMIDLENRLEFCGEGFRKWDLIRWNRLHYAIVQAKKDYVEKFNDKIFQEKVYFKYKNYEVKKDEDGKYYYWAPEKEIDMSSITWYGVDGDNKTAGAAASGATFCDEHGYRFAKAKGYQYLGFGKDNKDLNARSYANDAFGKDYEKLATYLPSICSGLVGSCDITTGDCNDENLKVKNRYLMPIGSLVLQSSNGRLYNSYEY